MSHAPPVAWRVRHALEAHIEYDPDVLATMDKWCDGHDAETEFEVWLRADLAAVRLLARGSQSEPQNPPPNVDTNAGDTLDSWLQLEPGSSRSGHRCTTEAAVEYARKQTQGVDLGPLSYLVDADLVTATSWSTEDRPSVRLTARPAGLGARVEIDNVLPAWRLLGLDVPDIRVLAAIAAHSGSLRLTLDAVAGHITSLAWTIVEPDHRTVLLVLGAQRDLNLAALTMAQTTLAEREVRTLHVGADRSGLYLALSLSIA